MNNKKILALSLFSLLFVSILVGVVAAQGTDSLSAAPEVKTGAIKALWDALFGGLFQGVTDWSFDLGTYKVQISQILLGLLTLLLVYSVSDWLPFFPIGKDWLKWAFSLVVATLSFLFVRPETITGIVGTYEALGVVLTSIIPLLIILGFTIKLRASDKWGAYAGLINKVLLIGFFLWMILKYADDSTKFSTFYLGTALIALVWVFIEKKAWKWLSLAALKSANSAGETRGKEYQVTRLNNRIEELTKAIADEGNFVRRQKLERELKIVESNRDTLSR